jgi:hypothetical protein
MNLKQRLAGVNSRMMGDKDNTETTRILHELEKAKENYESAQRRTDDSRVSLVAKDEPQNDVRSFKVSFIMKNIVTLA